MYETVLTSSSSPPTLLLPSDVIPSDNRFELTVFQPWSLRRHRSIGGDGDERFDCDSDPRNRALDSGPLVHTSSTSEGMYIT